MANVLLSTKAVGSTVKLKVDGALKEFLVVHQGKPSSIYDDSCNGTWLLMKDCYVSRAWHSSNVNKYESSDINTYLNNTFLKLLDSNIQDAIKQVKIPYRQNGGSGGTDRNGANGLSTKIFLLSGYEVGFTTSDNSYFPVDGAKLSYFESGTGSSALNKRIANPERLGRPAGGSAPRAPTAPAACGSSTPAAVTTTTAHPSRAASAPLWFFPLHSWSLMTAPYLRIRPRPSPVPAVRVA